MWENEVARVATSHKQVMFYLFLRNQMEIARTFMYFYAQISGQSFL